MQFLRNNLSDTFHGLAWPRSYDVSKWAAICFVFLTGLGFGSANPSLFWISLSSAMSLALLASLFAFLDDVFNKETVTWRIVEPEMSGIRVELRCTGKNLDCLTHGRLVQPMKALIDSGTKIGWKVHEHGTKCSRFIQWTEDARSTRPRHNRS